MRVAILGGWGESPAENRAWKLKADAESRGLMAEACRELGRRLARRQHTVVVGSEKKNSADFHVVRGMLEEIGGSSASLARIEVIEGVESQRPLYLAEREGPLGRYFSSINPSSQARPVRSAEKILAVRGADVVLTVGGLAATWTGGVAAMVAKKPVVPIGTFGGASRQLLQLLKICDHALKSSANERQFDLLDNNVWSDDLLDTAFELGKLNRPRVFFGYCGKAAATAAAVVEYLTSLGFEVLDWATDFRSGRVILDEIHEGISSSNYGLFLFTPDDLPGKGRKKGAPRDNVVFEAGYFMGAHGRERTVIIIQRGAKIPADYGGHIYIPMKRAGDIAPIKRDLCRALGLSPATAAES